MPRIVTSALLDAPPDEVWPLLRDFSAIGSWHPHLPPPEVHGAGDQVGAERTFPAIGGLRERLVALDDDERTTRIAFQDSGGLPVRDYRAALRVTPASDSRSLVEWTADFDCDLSDEPAVVATVRDGVFLPGLAALKERFA
ncbi:SRPBCC family protein [Lentzea sp. NPDC051838]|uniref:SRPBCC family protein n=1 Tax=Lentzea sp. NPDC051838 TaxID=3154849 RepID=UPI00342D4EB3